MNWTTVVLVGLVGFFGAGAVSMWRTGHRFGAGIVAAIAVACLVLVIVSLMAEPTGD